MNLLQELLQLNELNAKKDVSFFSMDDIKAIEKMSIADAQKYAIGKIDKKTKAKPENIAKAKNMVSRSKSVMRLMQGMTNFLLSSENMKVIK